MALGRVDLAEGNGTGIVAFDKLTGKVKYKITDELASYASLKLATIDMRRWCFAFCRGGLVGFEPATGKVDFEYPWRARILESVNASMPVVVGREVFISETYGPGSTLLHARDEVLDDLEVDVRLEEGEPDLPHRLGEVVLGQLPMPPEIAEGRLQLVGKCVEHAGREV